MTFNALQNSPSQAVIKGDGFWPDINVAEFQRIYRMPAEYAESTLVDHIALSRLWVTGQLLDWRETKESEGYTDLNNISLAGVPDAAGAVFKRAVFCHAKSILLAQMATSERREAARNDAKEEPEAAASFAAWANEAVALLLGRSRITVGLL